MAAPPARRLGTQLIANHGNGRIAAFDRSATGSLGFLLDAAANPIRIDGIWAIGFGDGAIADLTSGLNTGPCNACYFTAAPQGHGLFGAIVPARAEQMHDEQ